MWQPLTFDAAKFKADWKAGCKRRHIDTEAGPTSYQVALVKAEQRTAQKRRDQKEWRGESWVWEDWPRVIGKDTAPVKLIDNPVVQQAVDPDSISMMDLTELWCEVKRELFNDLTLKERHRLHSTLPTARELLIAAMT